MPKQSKDVTKLKTTPFQGGMNTYNEPGLLPNGTYSAVRNLRQMHPGLKQRTGIAKQHSTADSTNRVLSMFQFSKGKRTERHFYAQLSDGDVLEATTNPPGITTGVFGSEVHDGSTGQIPASWSIINDELIYSNGVDQHQICAGTANQIKHFAVYDNAATRLPDVPSVGYDYTEELNDSDATSVAVLDSLGTFDGGSTGTVTCTLAGTDFTGNGTAFTTELHVGQPVYVDSAEVNFIATITSNTEATVKNAWAAGHAAKDFTASNDCILICTPIMPNRLTFTVSAANGTASVANVSYYSSVGSFSRWKNVTLTDGTVATGKTLAVTGSMTWTQPTDAVPTFMYGMNGFWTKISFSAALDAEVEISSLTYGSGFTSIQDVWDGDFVDAIEAQFYDQSLAAYYIYGSTSITMSGATSSDEVYFNSPDPIVGFYIDVAGTPNTTASTTIDHVEYLNAVGSWTTVGTYTDGTTGLSKSGYVTFGRQSGIVKTTFNSLPYNSYWYRFGVDKTLSASVTIGIQVLPYYSINYFGRSLCSAAWKGKAVYVFDQDPSYIYITPEGNNQSLSSSNTAIFQVGDGRSNKIVAVKPFYNEILVAQEEKGAKGGSLTLVQGTKPEDLGKIVISDKYGAMNANCMEVVETVEGGHNAFILSRYGVMVTNGKVINYVPGFESVRNYFDPSSSDCIRTGYESKMYISHDSCYHVLKIGLTSGSSATDNNVFLVYDLIGNYFMDDSYANNFSCECDCDAASGNVPVVRLGGGQADGTVYLLNYGTNDVSTAVDSYVTIELNNDGKIARNAEMIIRADVQAAGKAIITPYHNGIEQSDFKRDISLKKETSSSERIRRHRIPLNFKDQNISVKIEHNNADESFYLFDWGVLLEEYTEQ